MRSLAVMLLVGAISVTRLSAQESGQWAVGFLIGNTFTQIRSPQIDDANLQGFTGGGFVERHFGARGVLGVRLEALFVRKGSSDYDDVSQQAAKISYLEFPLLLRARMASSSGVRPVFQVGPYMAFTLSCDFANAVLPGTPIPGASSSSGTCKEFGFNNRSYDAGVTVSVGLELIDQILVEVRYDYGLVNIVTNDDLEIKNSALLIMVGWRFTIGG